MTGYIWEDYSADKKYSISGKNCSFLETVFPYQNVPDEAEVNTAGRFSSVFTDEVLHGLTENKSLNDTADFVLHFLAHTDLLCGRLSVSWDSDVIYNEIINGCYGAEIAQRMKNLSPDDRHLFLHYLKVYHDSGERKYLFHTVFMDLFGKIHNCYGKYNGWHENLYGHSAEIYHRLSDDVWFYFCAVAKTPEQENRFELAKLLFADYTRDIRPIWGNVCFGIIGCDDFMQSAFPVIDGIQIL